MKGKWEIVWVLLAIFVLIANGCIIAKLCQEAFVYYIAGLLAARYLLKRKQ